MAEVETTNKGSLVYYMGGIFEVKATAGNAHPSGESSGDCMVDICVRKRLLAGVDPGDWPSAPADEDLGEDGL